MSSLIPIENIYFLLCYAWNKLEERDITQVSLSPETDLPGLFSRVLRGGVAHLLKRGIDRSYVPHQEELRGVRGRLEFATSIKHSSFERARAWCTFDELSADVLQNQIIKTTLRRLFTLKGLDKDVAGDLRDMYRRLHDVREVDLSGPIFSRVVLNRNNAYYGFLLNVCEIVYHNLLPDERTGRHRFRDFTRDDKQMAALFESFLFNFFVLEQKKYQVSRPQLAWLATGEAGDIAMLPGMRTDIVLRSTERTVVVDAKYYGEMLAVFFQRERLRADHLYQLFAYMKHIDPHDPGRVGGMLIYPRVNQSTHVKVDIQGHPVVATTLNLAQPWPEIRRELLGLVSA